MKKVIAAVLTILLVVQSSGVFAGSLSNFQRSKQYREGDFTDIQASDWFYENVANAFEYGMASGVGDGLFSPYGLVNIAEAITFAVRVSETYQKEGKQHPASGSQQWYEPYVAAAIAQNIIKDGMFKGEFERPATRSEVAYLFAKALPYTEFENINTAVKEIPDMHYNDKYYNEVIMLFRAGVINGKDEQGNFSPNENITRAETAAIVNRVIDKSQRRYFEPKTPQESIPSSAAAYNAEQIAEMASSSVFRIDLYDPKGVLRGTGSGFFISKDGVAVTNYHVIDETYAAKAVTVDGTYHDITLVYGYDAVQDVAIIQVEGSGYQSLPRANSSDVKNGQKIFCIGSPKGLDNSISEGVISNTSRSLDGADYIQITAPISPGSSGGAVLNDQCEVIGVSTGALKDAQNLNLAVPSNKITLLDRSKRATLASLYDQMYPPQPSPTPVVTSKPNTGASKFYSENNLIPNYEYVTGQISTFYIPSEAPEYLISYFYPLDENKLKSYIDFLEQNGFVYEDGDTEEGLTILDYSKNGHYIHIGYIVKQKPTVIICFDDPTKGHSEPARTTYIDYKEYPGLPDYTSVTGVKYNHKGDINQGILSYGYRDNRAGYEKYINVLITQYGFERRNVEATEAVETSFLYLDGDLVIVSLTGDLLVMVTFYVKVGESIASKHYICYPESTYILDYTSVTGRKLNEKEPRASGGGYFYYYDFDMDEFLFYMTELENNGFRQYGDMYEDEDGDYISYTFVKGNEMVSLAVYRGTKIWLLTTSQ